MPHRDLQRRDPGARRYQVTFRLSREHYLLLFQYPAFSFRSGGGDHPTQFVAKKARSIYGRPVYGLSGKQ